MKKTEEFKIFSEADLEREFDSIGSQLIDTKIDWNQRMKALKRMQSIISSEYIAFENFPALFLKFTAPLSIQLQDLRSAVVKEATITIISAAQVMGDSFDLCAERLSDVLYRLINSGNKILAETGSDCYIEIIRSVVTWRLIPKTLEQFSCKNPNIRIKAITFLQLMLELYPCEVFEYAASSKTGFLDKIEQGLKLAVHDANNDTRAIARKAFLNYRAYFPARAAKIFQTFDASIQRAFGELTENRFSSTPARSTSANSNRIVVNMTKSETKSIEKKARSSLNEIKDLSGTGGTTPDAKSITQKDLRPLEKSLKDDKPPREDREREERIREEKIREERVKEERVKEERVKEEPSLEFLISSTNDQSWATRVSSFESIRKKLCEEATIKIVSNNKMLWDQIISVHLDHLIDNNFKVVVADLASLCAITDTYPEKISLALERILPKLLGCLSDSKELVITVAGKLLELIIDIYIPEDLLALLLKYSSQELKPTSYIKFIEVMHFLADSSTDFFTLNSNIKNYILKLIFVLKEIPRNCVKVVMPSFELCITKNRIASSNIINELPQNDLKFFRTILIETSSPLEPLFREQIKESYKEFQKPVAQLQEVKKISTSVITQEIKKTPTVTVTQEIKKTPTPTVSQEIKKTPTTIVSQEFKRPTAVITQVAIVQKNSDKTGNLGQDQIQEIRKPVREDAKLSSPLIKEENKGASPIPKHETLKKIQKLNDEGDDNIWERSIKDILNKCEECVEDNSLTETALLIFYNITKKRKNLCQNYINDCLRIMSKGYYLDNRHILQTTEECMEELVMGLSASNIIPIIIQYVKNNDSPATQAFIRILTKIIIVTKPTGLMGLMRIIINQMKDSLNHSNADVRKSVVFCLVEIQAMMQNEFTEYLEELTPSQQKLVTIYIQRRLSS
ncbi:hypothetical protein SteCoe_11624 [Stentor coeruleus]|uniref:TOG domain-containing protein n=1 Tax=Stentor coeruleus TaxID=5963 RepID=A0A1R2CCT0_9CILI|nr:hypothetical protein SteCoe_11624 [Stentor coeruleus]